jgi:hypothetical protein
MNYSICLDTSSVPRKKDEILKRKMLQDHQKKEDEERLYVQVQELANNYSVDRNHNYTKEMICDTDGCNLETATLVSERIMKELPTLFVHVIVQKGKFLFTVGLEATLKDKVNNILLTVFKKMNSPRDIAPYTIEYTCSSIRESSLLKVAGDIVCQWWKKEFSKDKTNQNQEEQEDFRWHIKFETQIDNLNLHSFTVS